MNLNREDIEKILRRIFLGILTCILFSWVLHDTARIAGFFDTVTGILSPFIVGAILAFILNVPMRGYERMLKGIKNNMLRRCMAAVLACVSVLVVIIGVCLLLIPQLIETVQTLIPTLSKFFDSCEAWLRETLKDNPELLKKIEDAIAGLNWASLAENGLKLVGDSLATILDSAFSVISAIAGGVFNAFISIVFAVYGLLQKENLARQGRKLLYAFLPEKAGDEIVRILRLSGDTFSNFLSGQCLEVVILGAMFAVSMAIFGMPYIPLISVLIAVTAFIPVVGAWVGCIFGAFFILVSDPAQAVAFVIMFVILQQIENQLIYPRVVGTSIGLPGMWVLLAVSLGGSVMGVAGMFLMIPLVSVIYTLMGELANKRLAKKGIDPQKLEARQIPKKSKFRKTPKPPKTPKSSTNPSPGGEGGTAKP